MADVDIVVNDDQMEDDDEQAESELITTTLTVVAVLTTAHVITVKNVNKKQKRKKKIWSQPSLLERDSLVGAGYTLGRILSWRNLETANFKKLFKMTAETFNEILHRVSPLIKKFDTKLRQAISPELRLVVTLRYLLSGKKNVFIYV